MAKHKAATEITIVTEERSPLAKLVDRYKFHFLASAAAITGGILFLQSRGHAAVSEDRAQWADLYQALGGTATGARPSAQTLDAEALQRAATNLNGKPAADWARMLAAFAKAEANDFSGAHEAALQLQNSGSELFNNFTLPLGKDGAEVSLAAHLKGSITATEAFRKQYEHLYTNPNPPADAPVVTLETGAGNIEVALYSDLAPKHVENFLKLARENFYDGTKFHRVMRDFMIQGGDPNSKEGAPETWGQGGPGYKIDKEVNSLIHLPMYLAAAKVGREVQSSGSQFYITTGSPHHLDGEHVIYGKVIAGEDVVRKIEAGEADPTNGERPRDPVLLTDVRVKGE